MCRDERTLDRKEYPKIKLFKIKNAKKRIESEPSTRKKMAQYPTQSNAGVSTSE